MIRYFIFLFDLHTINKVLCTFEYKGKLCLFQFQKFLKYMMNKML